MNLTPPRSGLPSTNRPHRWAIALALITACGCAGYRIGARTMYPVDVQTVHVPVFESDSIRPYLSQMLTEAVIKEIELKTHFKVVPRAKAETVLQGRIINDSKRVLVENINDEPRDIEVALLVQVQWTTSQGQPINPQAAFSLPDSLIEVSQTSNLVPEVGHSMATAQQQAIGRMAEQIVAMMEVPW